MAARTRKWRKRCSRSGLFASDLSYDLAGALTGVDYGNGTISTRTYNAGGQLERLQHGVTGNPETRRDVQR